MGTPEEGRAGTPPGAAVPGGGENHLPAPQLWGTGGGKSIPKVKAGLLEGGGRGRAGTAAPGDPCALPVPCSRGMLWLWQGGPELPSLKHLCLLRDMTGPQLS